MLNRLRNQLRNEVVEKALEEDRSDWQPYVNQRASEKMCTGMYDSNSYIDIIESYDGPEHVDEWGAGVHIDEHMNSNNDDGIEDGLRKLAATTLQHATLDDLEDLSIHE